MNTDIEKKLARTEFLNGHIITIPYNEICHLTEEKDLFEGFVDRPITEEELKVVGRFVRREIDEQFWDAVSEGLSQLSESRLTK